MNLFSALSWITTLRRQRLRWAAPDFGDMGTAFGLDASMVDTAASEDLSPARFADHPSSHKEGRPDTAARGWRLRHVGR